MAGDWLKIEVCLPDKPEVWHMYEITGIDPDAIVGKLIRVWAWSDWQPEDGNACFVSETLIDKLSGVTGFADAMRLVGWLEIDGPEISVPNFTRHNGKTAKNRALTAKRVANHKAKGNVTGNDEVTNEPLPREEKRREELKEETTSLEQPTAARSRFSDFWSVYPKKVGKKPAEAKWRAKRLDAVADRLIADVRKRITDDGRWVDGFVPDPKTYLTQERWEDEMQPRRDQPKPSTTASYGTSPAREIESPLESAIAWAKQQHCYGQIDDAECARLIGEATEKHRSAN